MSNTEYDDLPDVDGLAEGKVEPPESVQPLYQIFEGSRIAVGSATGKMWRRKIDAAMAAYEHMYVVWEDCFKYYNNDQNKDSGGPDGNFHRGDGTENIVFSNLNIMLPATYSKDPDISCSTTDEKDQPFCNALEALINVLFKTRKGIQAKPKIKKGAGIGLLTNCGVLKMSFTKKDDSREFAVNEMNRITEELAKAKKQEQIQDLYGQLEALEQNLEVLEPSGFGLGNVLPHNLIIDPNAEQSDGMDAAWMAERVFLPTASLTQRFTKREEGEDGEEGARKLIYKPTHKAKFAEGGNRDDGMGVVMEAFEQAGNLPTSHTEDERSAYINMYFTECYFVWDRITRRLFLFEKDDWEWPIWVWDDPLKITRFFPYFVIAFSLSTGGTVSAGETAYILDQQDEINDINRQKSRIRRSLFNFFFYNSDKIDKADAEKFIKAIRGEITGDEDVLVGIRAGEMKVSECIETFLPPSAQYEPYFDKAPILDSINRITNTSDALRGTQFKTNTNVASVKSYEQSMRVSVGAKVDVIEDTVADLAHAMAEVAVQEWDQDVVAGYIGAELASGWAQMDLAQFNAQYTVTLVAGSMEKATSAFKKQEAIEVVQAVGQFAQAAPATTLMIMLKVLEKAFTEVVIKPEDWKAMQAEIAQLSQQQAAPAGGTGGEGEGGDDEAKRQALEELKAAAEKLPPEDQETVIQMHQRGDSEEEILAFVQQKVTQGKRGTRQNGSATKEPVRQR